MKGLWVATSLMTACLFSCPSVSPPSLASVAASRCDLETIGQTEAETVTLRSIYVSETNGAVLEVCVDTNNAKLTISELGEMTLLQRDPTFEVDYYTSGSRDGRIKRIGDISFDYYTTRSKLSKLRQIGDLQFDYYTTGGKIGKLRRIGGLRFDYYTSGPRDGKLEQIGNVSFDYDREGRMETRGTLSDINLAIVDLIVIDAIDIDNLN